MNERIRLLAEQAKFMAEEDINKQISYNAELRAFAEKFAELMVLEFIEIIASSDPTRNIAKKRATTKILSEPYSSIITRIEDHFGVDE